MKAFKLLALLLVLTGFRAMAQPATVTLQITGHVSDILTGQPIPAQQVIVMAIPDSINLFVPIIDSTLTDNQGNYSVAITTPWNPGTMIPLSVTTIDCQNYPNSVSLVFTGNTMNFVANFIICYNPTPPNPCDNFILMNGVQQLTASFHGGMMITQPATYTWDFGDGSVGYGEDVTHTYQAAGTYMVNLSTITPDNCFDQSQFSLFLGDTIPVNCYNWFNYTSPPASLLVYFEGYTMAPNTSNFLWSFGDPGSGTANTSTIQNPAHQFSASGVYNVVLTTSDFTGCTYTSVQPVFVDSTYISDSLSITGSVYTGNLPLPYGHVTLFRTDSLGGFIPVQETWFQNSVYTFNYLTPGNYIIQAIPDPGTVWSMQYLPTYFGDVIFWEDASVINLGYPQNPYDIHLVPFDSLNGGIGGISGQIIQGGGKSVSMANQEVVLVDAGNNPVYYIYTDPDGNFNFPSLPLGYYQVHPNITGITAYPVPVQLDATNTHATVIMTINGNTITGLIDRPESQIIGSIYPNPVEMEMWIPLAVRGSAELQAEILDSRGRSIMQVSKANYMENCSFRVNVEQLAPGLYFIRVMDSNGNVSTRKFLKK
jgi:PKD repeat protein